MEETTPVESPTVVVRRGFPPWIVAALVSITFSITISLTVHIHRGSREEVDGSSPPIPSSTMSEIDVDSFLMGDTPQEESTSHASPIQRQEAIVSSGRR
jgi:hypothetical protein